MKVVGSLLLLLLVLSTASAFRSSSSNRPTFLSSTAASHQEETVVLGQTKTHNHCKSPGDRDILVRAARGERVERTPVWLMRQAGRYMEAFREYSNQYPFRVRSETPDYAVELSLQCHRAYGMDGIIMFSDILTPLPALGIDFDVVKGQGPVIHAKIATVDDVRALPRKSFDEATPFIAEILQRLDKEAREANTSLIGFVGAPFTLAAYTIEGQSSKHCLKTKQLLLQDERVMEEFLDVLAELIGDYANYQIQHGAQVIQVFESWAHQLSPQWFQEYAKPAAQKAIRKIKQANPDVPVIYFCNGGSSYLELQRDTGADMIAVDWHVNLGQAREILGPQIPVSGNIDPTILMFGSQQQIEQAVRDCIDQAGGPGCHLLNLGHGVMQGTPELAVKWLVDEAKRYQGKEQQE